MSGTFRRKRKSLSRIYSVLRCTIMALCFLARPSCSWSTFLDGAGVSVCASCCQPMCQLLSASLRPHMLTLACSTYISGGGSALGPDARLSRHAVAPIAAISAASLPAMPSYDGIHRTTTVYPQPWSNSTLVAICSRMYAPNRPSGSAKEQIAAWLSAKILI
jgi:hypothetical protein